MLRLFIKLARACNSDPLETPHLYSLFCFVLALFNYGHVGMVTSDFVGFTNDISSPAIKNHPSKQLRRTCICMRGPTNHISWAGLGLLSGYPVYISAKSVRSSVRRHITAHQYFLAPMGGASFSIIKLEFLFHSLLYKIFVGTS